MIKNILFAAGGITTIDTPMLVGASTVRATLGVGTLTFDIDKPANATSGDLLIAIVASAESNSWGSSGWTRQARTYPDLPEYEIFTRTHSSASTYTFSRDIATYERTICAYIIAYRDAAFDAVGTGIIDTASTMNVPEVTVSEDNSVVLTFVVHESASASITGGTLQTLITDNSAVPSLKVFRNQANAGGTGATSISYTPSPGGASGIKLSIKYA